MAINARIPSDARVRYPVARFRGLFNAGQYNFNDPINENVNILEVNRQSIYLIERINFSATIDEGIWLSSQRGVEDYPNFRLDFEKSLSQSIYPEPVRALNYLDNAEQLIYFNSAKDGDILRLTFRGIIDQVAETVGLESIFAQVSFTLYQIDNVIWKNWFMRAKSEEFGSELYK